MARRRGRGEGSITQRSDGRWQGRVNLGRGPDGRRKRKYVYGATEADVVRAMKKQNGRAAAGALLSTSTPTTTTFLEEWFQASADTWRPNTRRAYRRAIDGFLVPAFGPLRLEQLSPRIVQRWLLQHKTAHGARRRIELAHAALRSALSEAQRLQLVTINAAMLVRVPKPPRRPIAPLSLEHARLFLVSAKGHRLGALFSVALACGLRLGEALGLKWDDVNLETGEVQIRRQLQRVKEGTARSRLVLQDLKTEKSRRTLLLPQVCIERLKTHRTQQRQERLKTGSAWTDSGLVFTTYAPRGAARKVGVALQPRNVLRALHQVLESAELPRVRFHDLRHGAASLLIAEGVELVEVCQLLGHSELRVTADLYAHLQKQTAAKAARLMDAVLNS